MWGEIDTHEIFQQDFAGTQACLQRRDAGDRRQRGIRCCGQRALLREQRLIGLAKRIE